MENKNLSSSAPSGVPEDKSPEAFLPAVALAKAGVKEEQEKKKIKRKFKGVVVSDKMDKTIVVQVNQTKIHPIYKKRFITSKKYKVHDEKNEYKTGDKVIIQECRPLSKEKRWRVIGKI